MSVTKGIAAVGDICQLIPLPRNLEKAYAFIPDGFFYGTSSLTGDVSGGIAQLRLRFQDATNLTGGELVEKTWKAYKLLQLRAGIGLAAGPYLGMIGVQRPGSFTFMEWAFGQFKKRMAGVDPEFELDGGVTMREWLKALGWILPGPGVEAGDAAGVQVQVDTNPGAAVSITIEVKGFYKNLTRDFAEEGWAYL